MSKSNKEFDALACSNNVPRDFWNHKINPVSGFRNVSKELTYEQKLRKKEKRREQDGS